MKFAKTTWLCAFLLLVGCETSATQLLVVVDIEYPIPSEVDGLQMETTNRDGSTHDSVLVTPERSRVSFGIVPRQSDESKPANVRITLLRGSTVVAVQEQIVSFSGGETVDVYFLFSPDGPVVDGGADTIGIDGGVGFCGDGTPQGVEECDDGNEDDGDGCNGMCQRESCMTIDDCAVGMSCIEAECVAVTECTSDFDCGKSELCCPTASGTGCFLTYCPGETGDLCGDAIDNDMDGSYDCDDCSCQGSAFCGTIEGC